MAKRLKIPAERGPLLDGVLFDAPGESDTVVIAITGIHGNFYSNPFYVNFGETLNAGGVDFVYAQTCDAFGQIETEDWRTGERVVIGSQTEDFGDTVDDVRAYVNWAERRRYGGRPAHVRVKSRHGKDRHHPVQRPDDGPVVGMRARDSPNRGRARRCRRDTRLYGCARARRG